MSVAVEHLDAGPDYSEDPCVCGHAERRHLLVSGMCRNYKRCGCGRFINAAYVEWLRRHAIHMVEEVRRAEAELRARTSSGGRAS